MADLEPVVRLTGPLAQALEGDREGFNARFARASVLHRRLDATDMADHLVDVVDPLVRAVARVDAGRVAAVTDALFDLSLDLLGKDLLSRHPEVRAIWVEVLKELPGLVAAAPRALVSSLSNAAYNIAVESPDAAAQWLEDIQVVGPRCRRPEDFLEAAKVLAWRCGMAHYRDSAIDAWLGLPEDLAALVLPEIEDIGDRAAVAEDLRQPWADSPEGRIERVAQVGRFRGFGGPFIRPPRVATDGHRLFVTDQSHWWTLHADRYGATLKRLGQTPPEGLIEPADAFRLGNDELVPWKSVTRRFPDLTPAGSTACDGHTLAVALPHSHRVHLLARGTAWLSFE